MKLPPGVDGWGAGHGEDVFVAALPKGLGPGVGVDTSGVVVVPGQLVGVEPNGLVLVLVLVLLPKIVLEVLLVLNIVLLLLLLLLNIVLLLLLLNIVLLLLLLLNVVLLLLMVDATGELKLLLPLRAS